MSQNPVVTRYFQHVEELEARVAALEAALAEAERERDALLARKPHHVHGPECPSDSEGPSVMWLCGYEPAFTRPAT